MLDSLNGLNEALLYAAETSKVLAVIVLPVPSLQQYECSHP